MEFEDKDSGEKKRMLSAMEGNPSLKMDIAPFMDDRKKEVNVDDKKVNLTPKEYEILKLLLSHPDEVFSPSRIYSSIWKEEPYGAENTVAVHIRHLREKIEIDPAEPRYIKVIFGQGYKIEKGRSL